MIRTTLKSAAVLAACALATGCGPEDDLASPAGADGPTVSAQAAKPRPAPR